MRPARKVMNETHLSSETWLHWIGKEIITMMTIPFGIGFVSMYVYACAFEVRKKKQRKDDQGETTQIKFSGCTETVKSSEYSQ